MRTSRKVAVSIAAWLVVTAPAAADITSASLQIQGISLEVETTSVTTGLDIPTTVR